MNITIKESMLIRKCLGAYVSSQLLDFDKSPLFMELMTKLKDYEKCTINYKYIDNAINKNSLEYLPNIKASEFIERHKSEVRKELRKELKKYSYQTICNKKVLELIKEERTKPLATIEEIRTIDHGKEKRAITQEIVNDIISKLNLDKKGDK